MTGVSHSIAPQTLALHHAALVEAFKRVSTTPTTGHEPGVSSRPEHSYSILPALELTRRLPPLSTVNVMSRKRSIESKTLQAQIVRRQDRQGRSTEYVCPQIHQAVSCRLFRSIKFCSLACLSSAETVSWAIWLNTEFPPSSRLLHHSVT